MLKRERESASNCKYRRYNRWLQRKGNMRTFPPDNERQQASAREVRKLQISTVVAGWPTFRVAEVDASLSDEK
jgi:hypothetical protein